MQQDTITNKQRKLMSEIRDYNIQVSIIEKMLIERLREIDYGNLVIVITDGVPQRTKVEISEMLTPDSFRRK